MSSHRLCALARAPRFPLLRVIAVVAASIGSAAASGCGMVGDGLTTYGSFSGADASLRDATGSVDAGSCHPGDVETYMPGAYRPATPATSGACVDTDGLDVSDAFYDACLGAGRTETACAAFKATSPVAAACAACVLTSYAADLLGPILDYGSFVGANVAGCIELTSPSGLSCAKAVQGLSDCEFAACQANCPVEVQNSDSLHAREQCAMAADLSGCGSYHAAAQCHLGLGDAGPDGGASSVCFNAAFKDFYAAVVPLFCGPPTIASAGADAGALVDGAPTDGAALSDADAAFVGAEP